MGTARVTISWQGIDEVIANLSNIEERSVTNLENLTRELANDTEEAWKGATPVRTGRLQAGDIADPVGMSFTLRNSVYFYKFVDEGHWTPRGWRTAHGYRAAKRRSHVEGRYMTRAALAFVRANITSYLSRFLK